MKRSALSFIFALWLAIPPAFAANCANPAAREGASIYNPTFHVYQFCNGANWIAFNAINPAAGGGGCSNPTAREQTIIYNVDHHILQYCDGTYWQAVGSGGGACSAAACPAPAPAGSGYLVMTKTHFDGNLGGLAGANAKCLTELTTTNTGWQGYATANARGQLTAAKVFAFLCDDATCNNLQANTTYYYANTNDDSAGGASFTTNGSGQGPGDSLNWLRADHFATILGVNWYAGRATTSPSLWSTGPVVGTTCTNWTTNNAGVSGRAGANNTFIQTRWNNGALACNNAFSIMCFVNQ
jgi:hypothetical protein